MDETRPLTALRRCSIGAIVLAIASCSGDDGGPTVDQNGTVGGQVLLSLDGPLVGAHVAIDQIDYFSSMPKFRVHEGDTTTDATGHFELLTGHDSGYFLVTAKGGQFVDYATGQLVALDPADELKTILYTDPLEDLTTGLVSPIGHLTQSLIWSRMEAGLHPSIIEAHAFATEHIDRHFGDLPWERMAPADLSVRQTSPTAEVRAAFILGAWSILAADTAAQAGSSAQEVNPFTLAIDLGVDLETGPFDGDDNNDRAAGSGIQLSVCPPVAPTCALPGGVCAIGACRTLCDAYAGSLRATLSGEVTKIINDNGPQGRNQTGLSIADTLGFARTMNLNGDEVLFGAACVEELDRLPPTFRWDAMPAEGAVVRGIVPVRVQISDDTDDAPLVTWDGGIPDTDGAPKIAAAMINTALSADGALVVTAHAVDASGNAATDARNLVTDNTAPTLSVSSTGFTVDAQGRWWTNATAPVLTGVVDDAHGTVTVRALISGVEVVSGAFGNGAWSITLPAGSVAAAGSDIVVRAVDSVGNTTTDSAATTPRVVIDTSPPVVESLARTVYDEATDTITFGTNDVPSHAHSAVATVSLGGSSTGCPMVSKHAYLTDTSPVGGESPARSTLGFTFRAGDAGGIGLDPGSLTYTVTTPGGATVGPYTLTATPVTGSPGTYETTALLYRNGMQAVAALGVPGVVEEGVFTVTVRARDLLGQETTVGRCWNHRPLGPPVRVVLSPRVAVAGAIVTTLADTYGLPSGPTSRLLNGTASAGIMEIWVKNSTLDPAYLTFAATPTAPLYTKRVTAYLDPTAQAPVASPTCAIDVDTGEPAAGQNALCYGTSPAPNPDEVISTPTAVTGWESSIVLYDVSIAGVIGNISAACTGCGTNEWEVPPGARRSVVVGAKKIPNLAPNVPGPYIEKNGDYTGAIDPGAPTVQNCITWVAGGTAANPNQKCTRVQRYDQWRELSQATLSLSSIGVTWSSASGGTLSSANTDPANTLLQRSLFNYSWTSTEN